MIAQFHSTVPQASQPFPQAPLYILRTATVLARFPIHNLTTHGRVSIHLRRTTANGDLDYLWEVSTSTHHGQSGPLTYQLDTLVINRLLDALPRPVPSVLKVGGADQVASQLGLQTSRSHQKHLKSAFHQNASAYIVTKLRHRDRDGHQRRLEAGFTRYSVVFQGECLPDGTPADAIYLVFSELYREILNHAPVRPLDYAYLQGLTPLAQRFYEILSYPMFAALTHRQTHATLRYSAYCLLSTQQRYAAYQQVKTQMDTVHQPHLEAGYIVQVRYTATTDADGQPDWFLHYTPGPRACAEYAVFMRQPGAEEASMLIMPADVDQDDLLGLVVPEVLTNSVLPVPVALVTSPASTAPTAAPPYPQAVVLAQQFYQRFHGLTGITPTPRELAQATALLTAHGEVLADFFLTYAYAAARETQYQPQVFGGILHYLPRALAAAAARTTHASQATICQTAAAERTQREQYAQWRQQALAALRAALSAAELAALEAAQQARLVAEGTAACALPFAVRLAVDEVLEAQAGLPDFAAWRQAQSVMTQEQSDATMSV